MLKPLDFISILATEKPQAAMIMLHGIGAEAEDLRAMIDALELPAKQAIEFILPRAASRPITVSGGVNLPAWFDIHALHKDSSEDTVGITQAVQQLEHLIDDLQQRGIARKHIFIGGFSQGGALALRCAYCSTAPLGGVIALSCYLPLRHTTPPTTNTTEPNTPIFLSHGEHDDVIPIDFAETSLEILRRHRFDVTWQTYPIGHHLDAQVVNDLSHWLTQQLTTNKLPH